MELWDAYDSEMKVIEGMTLVRGEEASIPAGVYHLVSHILVEHVDGTYLLMQRDPRKSYPNMWEATAGGSALKGETAEDCARRELREETGIVSDSLTEQYLFETEAGENLLAVECYSYHANLPMSAARAYLEKSGFVFMSSHYSKSYERDIDMFLSEDHLTRAFIYPWDYRNNRWFIYYEPASAAN